MSRLKPFIVVAICVVMALAIAGCSKAPSPGKSADQQPQATPKASTESSTPAKMPTHTVVNMTQGGFDPADLQVKVGTIVTWKNMDAANHSVTFDDGSVDSGSISPGKSASHTFDTPGTFMYHCSLHPTSQGRITVTK